MKTVRDIFFVGLLTIVFVASRTDAQINTKALARTIKPAIVTIYCYDSTHHEFGLATGFFISSTHIITNHHVVNETYEARCVFSDSTSMVIDGIVAENKDADLVMLECTGAISRHIHPLKLSSTLPEEGEQIMVIGTPLGLGHSVSEGIVSSIRMNTPIGTAIQFTAPVSEGSSGSPVITANGTVIGIVSGIMRDGENVNFAASSLRAKEMKATSVRKLADWVHSGFSNPVTIPKATPPENVNDSFDRTFLGGYTYDRGVDDLRQKKYPEAVSMFETAVQQQPENADAWFELGHSLGFVERYGEAADALEKAVTIRPTYFRAWLYLGKAYANSDAEKAEQALRHATGDASLAPDAFLTLGQVLDNEHRFQKAAEAFESCASLGVVDVNLFTELGHCYVMLKEYPKARTNLKKALSLDPYNHDALKNISYLDIQLNEFSEGATYLDAAVRHAPNDAFLLGQLGEYYRAMKRYSDAITTIQRQIVLTPESAVAHESLGMAYIDSGDKTNAEKELQILKTLDNQRAEELRNYMVLQH